MDVYQALQNMSLNEVHNFRAVEATVQSNPNTTTDDGVDQQTIDQLSAQIQDIKSRAATATQQTLELKSAIREAYNLSFDLEVWEQIPIDQQIEFGRLEDAVKYNDFFMPFLQPFVQSLDGLLERKSMNSLEVKMMLVNDYLPQVEANIKLVVEKLEERALTKAVDGITI